MDIREETIAKKIHFGVWTKILRYAFKSWPLLLLLLLSLMMTSFLDASIMPLLDKAAINALENNWIIDFGNSTLRVDIFFLSFDTNLLGYIAILISTYIIRSLTMCATSFLTYYLEMKILCALRRDSFRKIQELPFAYFDKTPSGWIIARVQSDTAKISDVLSWGIIKMFWAFFDIVFTLFTMFFIDWRLSLIILASTPLVMIVSPFFEIIILKLYRSLRAVNSTFTAWIAECISGIKTIKTLSIEDKMYEENKNITSEIKKRTFKARRFSSFFNPTIATIACLTTAMIILFGGSGSQFAVDVAVIVLFLSFVRQIYNPITDIAELFGDIMGTQANVEKILSLIETPVEVKDRPEVIEKYGTVFSPKTSEFKRIKGDISIKNVSFAYSNGIEIIHNMNLEIAAGETVAIVGETGSGKSTTVNLLCRFYEPQSGEIYIDGAPYRDLSLSYLHSQLGFVQQTPFIFGGTIADNIKYGKLDATPEEVIEASKIVGLHDFVMTFDKGYETFLEDGGTTLSVGQKQLISFARAIVRKPAIMILDEATASIDTATEASIQSAIDNSLENRTAIIIAHRLSTIVKADKIVVMKDGLIVEMGTHQELMKMSGGYYHKLYMNQFIELRIDEQIINKESI